MADTLDVLSLTDAKAAISMSASNTAHDAELARHITAISRILDDVVGPIVRRTITDEEHVGRRRTVQLRRWPVYSVTSVEEDDRGTVTVLSAAAFGSTTDGYRARKLDRDPTLLSGVLHRRRYGRDALWADEVQVTYVAGRYATTAAVDARFAEACASVLRRIWKREAGTWQQSSDVLAQLAGGDDLGAGSAFFRAVKPLVEELLFDEVQTHLANFA